MEKKMRRDWQRLYKTRNCKDDSTNRFFTPEDVARGIISRYEHGLKGKKIHCFADSTDSWFYKILKERFREIGLVKLVATEWVENGKGKQAVYDGVQETLSELEDDGSLFGECSKKTTAECDVVFTNPPFKKYSVMLKDVVGKKDFVLLAPHILPYRINDAENQIIYRIAKGEVFIEPKEIAIWNEDHKRQAACVVVSTIKPEGVQKVNIELSAKYDPAKHKMFIDAETGESTGVVNCDRFKDFPIDWPGLVAIPVTTLIKIANQKVHVNDVHGQLTHDKDGRFTNGIQTMELVDNLVIYGVKSRGDNNSPNMELVDSDAIHGMYTYNSDGRYHDTIKAMELVDSQAIYGQYGRNGGENSFLSGANCMELVDVIDVHGMCGYSKYANNVSAIELVDGIDIHWFYGKGDVEKPYIEFGKHKIIKVKLEDGRVPFQRIVVKLNRERRQK